MPCLFAVFALLTPRLLIVALWFFIPWFRGAFDSLLWPVLGLIFLPTTLLWYAAFHHWFGGQWSLWPLIGLIVALMIDLSPAGGRRRRRKVE
jgi:hypothetical protein